MSFSVGLCFPQETLTGFKWMGNRSQELMAQGQEVLFAFEEAIGYMCGCTVLDKDGISAAAVMAEFACWLAEQGKTFRHQLEELYTRSEEKTTTVWCLFFNL